MQTAMDNATILVVDDEFGPRESIRFLFKGAHEVLTAASVDEGLALLGKLSPDVIVMDIKMPGKSGIEGIQEIRAIDPTVSIIMLTGFGSLKTAQQAMRHGANDYVRKPFDTREMREIVERHIAATRAERRRAAAARELNEINLRMRHELQEKERLASLGQMSSEFVHDLRNPLSVIYGYVHLLMNELGESGRWESGPKEAGDYLDIIEKNVRRCDDMLHQWRERKNAVKTEADKERLSVATVLSEIAENSLPLAAECGARVEISPAVDDCSIEGSRTDLYRALHNLASNALQALPQDGGRIELSWSRAGEFVEIRVRDNGKGIPPDRLEQVFTPYYTTKKATGGMGLGLFITRNVIESHGGSLTLANNPDRGVTATVRLPLAADAQPVRIE